MVSTFLLLFFAIVAEVRGESDATAFGRRIDPRAVRQALTVALLSVGAVVASTLLLLQLAAVSTEDALFEVVSAFATVGLSTGITADLPTAAHLVLVVLMFVGRLGPITLVSALAMRDRSHLHRLPEGRPLIG
jgi:trk system potassium uptake protein TrkH